ncbi:MAG: glycosyltransferase, partial [Gemmatimonadaceae bacterium]
LGPWAPGIDEFLLDGQHCVWYRDLDDCVTQIEGLMADPEERERIRVAGEAFVRTHHTYDARLPFLLSGACWENPLAAATQVAARPSA